MIVLTNAEIERLLSMPAVIEAVQQAHLDLARGRASQPERIVAQVPSSRAILVPMTAALPGIAGVKLLADVPDHRPGAPRQRSSIVVLDPETGAVRAFLPGEAITRYRTAAASAVATRALSRPDSRVLGLVGAGAQARVHLAAIRLVRPIEEVRVWTRSPAQATAFAEELAEPGLRIDPVATPREAVDGVDVLATLTPALEPVVLGAWFQAGLHVNAVGAPPRADHREIDTEAVLRSVLVVDTMATAIEESGAIALPLAAGDLSMDAVRTELGDVLAGRRPGRITPEQITLFASVGLPIQDFAAARLVLDAAVAAGLGLELDLTGAAAELTAARPG
jgi:ornithine cyclodeaminase/alanine dehydrogenase